MFLADNFLFTTSNTSVVWCIVKSQNAANKMQRRSYFVESRVRTICERKVTELSDGKCFRCLQS